jgi:hypothetical protein
MHEHSTAKYASTNDLAESHWKNRVKKGGSHPSDMRNNGVSFEMSSIFKSSSRIFCSKMKIHKIRIKFQKKKKNINPCFFQKEKADHRKLCA